MQLENTQLEWGKIQKEKTLFWTGFHSMATFGLKYSKHNEEFNSLENVDENGENKQVLRLIKFQLYLIIIRWC